MKILFIADIVGRPGRNAVNQLLPDLKKEHRFDLVIANCENLSHGKGITEKTIEEMQQAGIDFFTSGNHIWRNRQTWPLLDDKNFPVIRPSNYPPGVPGRGWQIVKTGLLKKILLINLQGRVFMNEQCDCPFRKADEILEVTKHEQPEVIFLDFHAEATSEKIALRHYLDGRITAMVGTHTHVATADAQITRNSTAYITDVGMTGLKDSIIGIEKESVIKQFLTQLPQKHEISEGPAIFNAVIIETASQKATSIKQLILETS